jgi:ferredoxin
MGVLALLSRRGEAVSEVIYRVQIDADKCQGHGRCYSLAPELFDADDLGAGFVLGDGSVPDELLEQARRAVANCPEYAISLTEVQP